MIKTGLCITGSFCTFGSTIKAIDDLLEHGFDLTPIFSYNVSTFDTRFFKQADFENIVVKKTGKQPIKTIVDAEPIGTGGGFDLMIVAPCTGNTLAKLTYGVTDTPVTMAVKAHLRNNRPVVISLSSNDALGANGKNVGALLNTQNFYFVPFKQDAPFKKFNSLVADMSFLVSACKEALEGKQLQPVVL